MADSDILLSRLQLNAGWGRYLNLLGALLLVVAVLPFVATAVPQIAGADQSYVVLSGSMQPTMSPGDVILIQEVDPQKVEEGDILTFHRSGEATPTTHRVVEVIERNDQVAFRMKGDANEDPDPGLVYPSAVDGRVMSVAGLLFIIPAIGYVVQFANTQLGFILLVLLPVAAIAAGQFWSLLKASRPGNDSNESELVDSEAGAEPERSIEEDEVLVTFRAGELRLGLGVLIVFTGYAIVVAYLNTAAWSVGMAVAVGVGTLLVGVLYRSGSESSNRSEDSEQRTSKADRAGALRQFGGVEGGDPDD